MNRKGKIRIAWICHFTNDEIQKQLKPRKKIPEFASWISNLIRLFETKKDVELHIVSPHEYISGSRQFEIRGIRYHFFNAHMPLVGKHWPSVFRFDYLTDFSSNKKTVRKIIDRIQPDLIHLHGAENAYYSSTILQFNGKYPVLVTVQGFISHISGVISKQLRKRIEAEQQIFRTFSDFGYRTQTMGHDILKFNPTANLHWHHYPFPNIEVSGRVEKKYDCVFFARVTKTKGIEDIIKALSIAKIKHKIIVSLLVIGGANEEYLQSLKQLATHLDVLGQITWAGFLPTQKEVYEMASTARISLLPTYFEIISGTIIESMFLEIPVIANDVGSIHEVNTKSKVISLLPKGDVKALANEIVNLLTNKEKRKKREKEAHQRAVEMFNNHLIYDDLMNAYHKVIKDFNN